jgi:AcrR family transcriptional regulator
VSVADRTARRADLTDALLRVAAERGLDAVSVREVATAAGVSIGTVQHYFPTKTAMLEAAMAQMTAAVTGRIEALDRTGPVQEVTRRVLLELLPLDERRAAEVRVWLAFVLRAAFEPGLRRVQEETAGLVLDAVTSLVRAGQGAGEVPGARDPRVEAGLLMAVVDGLTLQAAAEPVDGSRQWVVDLLDLALARLFTRSRYGIA